MNTGKKIKLIRTFRGLTQKELGEACGIHEVAIRKYELGKNIPKPEQLRKIAEALNVNVNALVEFDIEADGDVLPLLFAIDEVFELLASGSQTADNYEIWKTIRPSVTKVVHED